MTPIITATNTNSLNSISLNETPTENAKTRRARTLYPCEADNPSELSFEANVIISNSKINVLSLENAFIKIYF